ncbi:D-aminoacyl-tRNA deacylase [Methanohalophilus levihalophilus]|uniref:D-aminoacyl-tRNA deacylase n=1 Tax=Methanohalophilus levihalophilus TaxID=1431282 RepID=UPI001FDAA62C|nr:D-aminoacyl-tRNA deacylase [Methanohalophilus levihalophilus]MBP2030037.1 D-aminoacyl-tRNA deacylase [Methanohalophilus levihalophilus]
MGSNFENAAPKSTIVCSQVDAASQNIKNHLLKLDSWSKLEIECPGFEDLADVYESGKFRLVEVAKHHVFQDGIDRNLEACGLPAKNILFASKHKSDDGRRLLTAHFTGNPSDAKYGGKDGELAVAYTSAIKPIISELAKYSENLGYQVSMESTHHGPTDLNVPSIYVEIGSGPEQWDDPDAGEAVAKAILSFTPQDMPVALGFGGGHYAVRQSEILMNNSVAFGHNFPSYHLENLSESLFLQAIEKSGADFVYMDRKSMSVAEKSKIEELSKKNGFLMLRESDINGLEGVSWDFFREVFEGVEKVESGSSPHISTHLRNMLDKNLISDFGSFDTIMIDPRLIHLTWKNDSDTFIEWLDNLPLVWLEKDNGTLSGFFFVWKSDAGVLLDEIVNECIKILKEHYEIEYIPGKSMLYLSEKRFNPYLAEELGIPKGPLYGKLSKGIPVEVDGNIVGPEMVHEKVTKELLLDSRVI